AISAAASWRGRAAISRWSSSACSRRPCSRIGASRPRRTSAASSSCSSTWASSPGRTATGSRSSIECTISRRLSGPAPAAAHAFRRRRLRRSVFVGAPNHPRLCRAPGAASLWETGAFAAPLGDVPIDDAFAAALLAACPLVGVDHDAHRTEHAVEVMLPFLQLLQPEARIVPLVLAWDDWTSSEQLGNSLATLIRGAAEPVLLLASSDLNHYEP